MENTNETVSIEELKEKFIKAQKKAQDLREEKIKMESQKESLSKQIETVKKEILEISGKDSYEEAVEFYNSLAEEVSKKYQELNSELDTFLNEEV